MGIAANRASSQQVLAPKVALALGKLVEMKVLSSLTDEVMEDLQKILASHMSLELYDDYGAGSLIKGFGSLSKVEGCSFKDSSLEHFSRLMKSYNQKYANAEIADIIAGVGLFGMAEFFPFDENSMDNLWGLVKR
ncbi:MAG: hypothetical protein HWD59_03560 [Coxiellaceae bacterium]|nr:MAG: hypothetical protein HWD59_03560 [Coxiellaceae bacterium]